MDPKEGRGLRAEWEWLGDLLANPRSSQLLCTHRKGWGGYPHPSPRLQQEEPPADFKETRRV